MPAESLDPLIHQKHQAQDPSPPRSKSWTCRASVQSEHVEQRRVRLSSRIRPWQLGRYRTSSDVMQHSTSVMMLISVHVS
jgi:hypothetical protein